LLNRDTVQKATLLLLVLGISILFVGMIRPFLMAILLAGIAAGMAQPLYRRLLRGTRGRSDGRPRLAASLCMLILLAVIVLPLLGILGIVAGQALSVSEQVIPWVQQRIEQPDELVKLIDRVPYAEQLSAYREQLLAKAGEIVGATSAFLFDSLTATTRGTVGFLFQLFVMLYAMFFFLSDGGDLLRRILYYLPLDHDDEQRLLDRFVSVTRATLKGTLVIGALQGGLAGAAFAVLGIDGALFWGTIMVLLSVVPGIGTGLVWIPAAVILAASGHVGSAVGLALWCALVVGSVDNFLRPRLVGRDTEMHDLMVLFSTMGGIMYFGVLGFVVGPIVAALFVTVWEIYGAAFRDVLPAVKREGKVRKS